MTNRILVVDDDPYILETVKRQLAGRYDLTTAQSGEEAIDAVANGNPFAIVVCDMNMPGIDGAETLHRIEELAPDTVRMMLTSLEDQTAAMAAVNKGHIFHFFRKPCPAQDLIAGIEEGIVLYGRRISDRQKTSAKEAYLGNLYRTLTGSEFPGLEESPNGYRIALVADPSVDVEDVRTTLEENGHTVIMLSSGQEFLDRFEEFQARLLMVTFETADLESRELIRIIKTLPSRRLSTILLVPPSMSKIREDVLQGFDDFIKLPCNKEELLGKVEHLVVTWDEILPFL